MSVEQLQRDVVAVETEAERLLFARQEMVECDKSRNSIREALSAMRREARTTRSSVLELDSIAGGGRAGQDDCVTCGSHDGDTRTWIMLEGADVFVRLPFHQVHTLLEKDQKRLDSSMGSLRSLVKEKALSLSGKGAISDMIGPSLLKSFVTLKDD
eukprot:TRINITY_DN4513_c0_g1_i2.p1 TRINITY_DN4513_c0_g1~~TRINITY_DN4513_c0_g1_i2.p1  ORF type:complete len:156 (+),score=24.72 TRINITY_DN4513_c0_g1_i2:101-568(+)